MSYLEQKSQDFNFHYIYKIDITNSYSEFCIVLG